MEKTIKEYKNQIAINLKGIEDLEGLHEEIRRSNDFKLKAANAELRKVKDIQNGLMNNLTTLKKEREILKLKKNQKEKEKEDKNSVFQNL